MSAMGRDVEFRRRASVREFDAAVVRPEKGLGTGGLARYLFCGRVGFNGFMSSA